jgi:hypothetical protein
MKIELFKFGEKNSRREGEGGRKREKNRENPDRFLFVS